MSAVRGVYESGPLHLDLIGQCTYTLQMGVTQNQSFNKLLEHTQAELLLKYSNISTDTHNTVPISSKDICFTHTQRLSSSELEHEHFSADYSFLDKKYQIHEYEFELIEYKTELVLECTYHANALCKSIASKILNTLQETLKSACTVTDVI